MRGLFGPGTTVLGGLALVMLVVIVVGYLLPTDWAAESEARLEATPDQITAFLDSPEGWRRWTPWPDSGLVRSGPERGAGSAIAWSDRELGSGTFEIDEVRDAEEVRYSVEVAGAGSAVMRTIGVVSLEPVGGGTIVRWREEGDLSRNPIMGFWALFMERAQSAEMAKNLETLGQLLAEQGSPIGSAPPSR